MTERATLTVRKIPNGGGYLNAVRRIWTLIFCCAALAAGPATAQEAGDIYTVSGVSVDKTASTAAEAREQALAEGHRIAFDRLLDRLVPRSQRGNLPDVDAREISLMLISFGIDEEKTSNVRYLAKLTFHFRKGEVRRFVRSHGGAIAESRARPILILPIFNNAGAVALWDDPNPWLAAWKNVPVSDGLVPIRVPVGDLADVRDITAEQAARADEQALATISERYGATGAIVATAALSTAGGRSLDVSTTFTGPTLGDRTAVRSFPFEGDDTLETVALRAAESIARQIEEDWKRENLMRFDNPSELVAVVSLNDLRDWVDIRNRLREVAFLRQSQLVSASRQRVIVRLQYFGAASQLQSALAQRDLRLEQESLDWTLSDARGPANPSPAMTSPAPAPFDPPAAGREAPLVTAPSPSTGDPAMKGSDPR